MAHIHRVVVIALTCLILLVALFSSYGKQAEERWREFNKTIIIVKKGDWVNPFLADRTVVLEEDDWNRWRRTVLGPIYRERDKWVLLVLISGGVTTWISWDVERRKRVSGGVSHDRSTPAQKLD